MRMSVAAAVACLSMMGLSTAHDAQAAIKKQTTIAAQGLGPALQQLARDRDVQLVYRSEVVGDRQTSGATGELTFEEALTQLLNGTGLTYQYLEDKAITIIPLPTSSSFLHGGGKVRQVSALRLAQGDSPNTPETLDPGIAEKRGFWHRFRLAQVDQEKNPGFSSAEGSAQSSNQDSGKRITLEEVVVTAQKRAERLQDVPISISVMAGADLDRSTAEGVTEALNRVPGVSTTIAGQGGGTLVTVRGVSASGPVFSGSSPIGYYVDSVPFGLARTGIAPDANAFDLQRVEILRGPQGTLYGASALNGVVRVLTEDAHADRFELKARTSASSTERGGENYRGDVAINVPIIEDRLAARAVVGYQDLSGWIDRPNANVKDANDAEILNARLKVNGQPTEALSIGFLAWLSRSDHGAPPYGVTDEASNSFVEVPQSTDYDVFGLKVGYELTGFSIASMTSHIDFAQVGYVDARALFGTPPVRVRLLTDLDSELFSQEVVLSSTGSSAWRWSFGGMYRDVQDHNYQFRINRVAPIDWTDTSESFAVFGEATRLFLDGKFELTAGLRYFEDEVTMMENQKSDGSTNPLFAREGKFDAITPRVVLTGHPNDQLTIYASYAEGFRSGFDQTPVALSVAPQFPPVEEDTLRNYELGVKGSLWDGRATFTSALYYIDWQDIQQLLVVPNNNNFSAAVVNAESASGIGVDFSLTTRPAAGLELGVNVGWNDLKLDSDVLSFGAVLFSEGERPSYSPEYTAGAFADLSFELGGGYDAQFSVAGNYTSEQTIRSVVPAAITGVSNVAVGDSMFVGRASLSINSPDRWIITLFVDNLTNEQGAVIAAPSTDASGDTVLRIRPRTIGAQLECSF